uniref:(northern house mosquito) hypothetical protein n=1 Tax=Culex pipiens TaxID=7175 RepID=A0A8D8F8M1_CULPI
MLALLQISVVLLAHSATSGGAADTKSNRHHVAEACSPFICDARGVKPGVQYCAPGGSRYADVSCSCKKKGTACASCFVKQTHACAKGHVFNFGTGTCAPDSAASRKPCEDYWRSNPPRGRG